MATFLDLTVLSQFNKIFILILIIIVAYAITANSATPAAAKWFAWIAAFLLGIFSVTSDLVVDILEGILPWIGLLFVFTLFVMVAGRTMGASGHDFMAAKWVLLTLTIAVFLVGAAFTLRDNVEVPGDIDEDGKEIVDDEYTKTSAFILHPTILGVIFTLLVGVFTVALLAGQT